MQTTNAGTLELEPLSFSDAGFLTENLAERNAVKISDQTRDLIAAQTGGNPIFIKFLVDAAHKREFNLDGFQKVQKIYAAELFGGKIGNFYDGVFDEIAPNLETQKSILGLLYDALTLDGEKTPVDSWQRRTGLSEINFYRTMRLLNIHEIVRTVSNLVEPDERQSNFDRLHKVAFPAGNGCRTAGVGNGGNAVGIYQTRTENDG